MIEILKMQAVGKDGNFAIMYFDFLFQNMNELPNIVYRLGNVTYVVADGSTAIHKENHSLYKYNNRKWFKVATTTPPEIPNPDYVDSNGKHNIPNNEIHGYRTLDINVAQGTTDYDELTNKPTINGIEVAGTLTGSDLGLQDTIVGQDGLIETQYIPPEVFERMYAVQDDTERFALTTEQVQNGDFVYVESTNLMYLVVNDEHLDTESGYKSLAAGIAAKAIGDEDGNNIKSTYVKIVDEYNAGKTVPEGTSVSIGGTTYTVGAGAEIFNSYNSNKAVGNYSHSEGASTKAVGSYSHSEGSGTKASGETSHAEGSSTTASGESSHAEGSGATASGSCSHAEGIGTTSSNYYAHAEGGGTTASGACSHAEGGSTTASGESSHAEGGNTTASGNCSHAEGGYTKASSDYQHVEGKYNVEDSNNKFAHIIGNGTSNNARSNAYAIDWQGRIYTHNSNTGFDIQSNYIEFPNGQRLYNSSSAPTGDIPDGSIGVGW